MNTEIIFAITKNAFILHQRASVKSSTGYVNFKNSFALFFKTMKNIDHEYNFNNNPTGCRFRSTERLASAIQEINRIQRRLCR